MEFLAETIKSVSLDIFRTVFHVQTGEMQLKKVPNPSGLGTFFNVPLGPWRWRGSNP